MTMVLSSSILVVDDEQELATLFKEAIGRMGFDVYSFTSPLLALEYFKDNQEKFSLVITDLRMPELSGLELANSIRDVDKSINIFLITAFDTADIEEN
jgi:DNA-binding NtrC family response regulator